METDLPIYGLACPDIRHTSEEFETQNNCGCTMKQAPLKIVQGIVIDSKTGKPFEAGLVNIYNADTKKGTTTAKDGSFSIYASVNHVLVISFVGYKTIEIKAAKLPANIELQEKVETLNEVVITAGKKDKNTYLYAGMGVLGLLFIYAIAEDSKNTKKKS